jgi:hypothetical protein
VIYLQAGEKKLLVLDPDSVEKIKVGKPARSPDDSVVVTWTPDPLWLGDEIKKAGGDVLKIGALIEASWKRPVSPRPPLQPGDLGYEVHFFENGDRALGVGDLWQAIDRIDAMLRNAKTSVLDVFAFIEELKRRGNL